ncbi:MAG: type II toxin-antitoxin system prevent-host-death family antitoxin [Myxococcota bacterium]
MKTVNIHEAKTHLSQLLAAVEQGQEVIIARAGQPIARLLPFRREKRQGGTSAGRVRFVGDVAAPLPDELVDLFEGGDE